MDKLLTILATIPEGAGGGSTSVPINTHINAVGDGKDNLVPSLTSILNAIIVALGIVAVVVIIIGGINYMTSGGDSAKVKTAKNTILYGCIGLIICALAFAITNFVIVSLLGN